MTAVNVIMLLVLAFSLAGNVYLFLRYKLQIEFTDEALVALERVRKERDDMEKTIESIHALYMKELEEQRKMLELELRREEERLRADEI